MVLLLFDRQELHGVFSPICVAQPCANASADFGNHASTDCSRHACANACTDNRADTDSGSRASAHSSTHVGWRLRRLLRLQRRIALVPRSHQLAGEPRRPERGDGH